MNSRDLQISVFNHFDKYYHSRGVCIISDRQMVFYTQKEEEDGYTHETALLELDEAMYPNRIRKNQYSGYQNIVIMTIDKLVTIDLPESGMITNNQMEFIAYFLDELEEYAKQEKAKEICVLVCGIHKSDYLEAKSAEEAKEHISKIHKASPQIDMPEVQECLIGKDIKTIRKLKQSKTYQSLENVEYKRYYEKLAQYLREKRIAASVKKQEEYSYLLLRIAKDLLSKLKTNNELDYLLENFVELLNTNDYDECLVYEELKNEILSRKERRKVKEKEE